MAGVTLLQTVDYFTGITCRLPDERLDSAWSWGDYDEGVRFAFFRVYEELRTLAARLESQRAASMQSQSHAQRILTQYHGAYRDLQAVLLAAGDTDLHQPPGEGEWSLWEVLLHIVNVERGFFTVNLYALEGARNQDDRPEEITEQAWDAFWEDAPFAPILEKGLLADLLSYYDRLHDRILLAFVDVADAELQLPVYFWEKERMPLRFRLHRFDSHLRQHTVQAEKVLAAIGPQPSEAQRLLRWIYAALAQVEGVGIGLPEIGAQEQSETALRIAGYTSEIASRLA